MRVKALLGASRQGTSRRGGGSAGGREAPEGRTGGRRRVGRRGRGRPGPSPKRLPGEGWGRGYHRGRAGRWGGKGRAQEREQGCLVDMELIVLPELRDPSGSPCAETCESPLPRTGRAGAELGFEEGPMGTVHSPVQSWTRSWISGWWNRSRW